MSSFELAVKKVLDNEGELSVNPKDKGGITNFGISFRFLKTLDGKKYGLFNDPLDEQDIINLTIDQAKNIYLHEFWNQARFEEIVSQSITNYVFDIAVNMGISPAIKILQRACWAVFENRKVLVDDGILGNKTITLVNSLKSNYIDPICAAMRSERSGDYRVIVAHHPEQKEFIDGWLNRAYET